MKILLLGSTGQVGRELRRTLPLLGDVWAPTRADADLACPRELGDFVRTVHPDLVINAAAFTAVDKAEYEEEHAKLINAEAPFEMARACKDGGATFFHLSTDYVFSGEKSCPYDESDEVSPKSVYGKTKAEGERLVAEVDADALIFRTSWVHAPHGKNFVRTVLQLAREKDDLAVVEDQIGSPTSAALIAQVVTFAAYRHRLKKPLPAGIYHLTASGLASWHEVACFALEEAVAHGLKCRLSPQNIRAIKSADYPTAALRPLNSQLDCNRLTSLLDITLPSWKVGVRQTVMDLMNGVH